MSKPVPLEPDKYYHIYNHAVAKDNLFVKEANYHFFLKKYTQYILPVADTFAYCLMPNHFHFAVLIKDRNDIESIMRTLPKFQTLAKLNIENYVSKQFSNLFSSYSQAFNKQQNRRGTLFEKPFKRSHIDSDKYFRNMIPYIHFNPVHHGFVKDLRDWPYSSFESFFTDKTTNIKRNEVINWFDDKENFLHHHHRSVDNKMVLDLEYS